MRDLFKDFVKAIKTHLPNALISWDISTWLYQHEFCEWFIFPFIYYYFFNNQKILLH